jgi:hypothetical protein
MRAFKQSRCLDSIRLDFRNIAAECPDGFAAENLFAASNDVLDMLIIDDTDATTLQGNVDVTFTSDAAALYFILRNVNLTTDDEIEARVLQVTRKFLFYPENVRWDGLLGVIAKAVDILRRYSILNVSPTLFQLNDSFDHSAAILGGRYFPPVAVEALDYSFHGTAETQLNACLASVGVFIREHKRELVKRQGPTFLRFPRDVACFDGCSIVPPNSSLSAHEEFKVVLSLRVYKDVADVTTRPHATVSHEAAISTWRATEAAAAGLHDVGVEVCGAYQSSRYQYCSTAREQVALSEIHTGSDITSCPVDTISFHISSALQRLWDATGKCLGFYDDTGFYYF